MNLEDFMLSLEIWHWELYLSIYSARSDQSGVKSLDFVGCHDNFNFCMSIKTIKLIEQLQHGPLNLLFSSRIRIIPLCTYSIDLIDEDD
jgi:hypothetical protein